MAETLATTRYRLRGLDCADCARTVERAVAATDGVTSVNVNFASGVMRVVHRRAVDNDVAAKVMEVVRQVGYRAELDGPGPQGAAATPIIPRWWQQPRTIATIVAGLLIAVGVITGPAAASPYWPNVAYGLAIAAGGAFPAQAAWRALRHRRMDMNVLMTVAALGAAGIGDWAEGATVVFLFSVGEALESLAMERTRRSIQSLMELAPAVAEVRRGPDVTAMVPIDEVVEGDRVIVRSGGRLAVDGQVVAGAAAVNEAPITGESAPIPKQAGDAVFAGSINEQGYLEVSATAPARDSTLAKIVHLVEEAQGRKAPSQRFVDRFAEIYTPLVVVAAVLVATVPPFFGQPWGAWIYRALALLILACPCALVISTPVAIVAAVGRAARNGVLIKGGAHLEALADIKAVAFDKTGTLTTGRPVVAAVVPFEPATDEDELLRLAASLELKSEHPLGQAIIMAAQQRRLQLSAPNDFAVVPGQGVAGQLEQRRLLLGSPRLIAAAHPQFGLDELERKVEQLGTAGSTAVLLLEESAQPRLLGLITLVDQIRPEAAAAIRELRQVGVDRIAMVTGDRRAAAEKVAGTVGITDVRAELLPDQKLTAIEDLEAQVGPTLMVGDGVNDAPALAKATVGAAMGVAGTDVALETAGIALMGNELRGLPMALRLSKQALRIVRQNVAFSLLVKTVALLLLVPGWLTLWLAILADTGASLVVIANGLRLLRRSPAKSVLLAAADRQ